MGYRENTGKGKLADINPHRVSHPDDKRQHDSNAGQQVGDEDLLRQLAEVALATLMAFEVERLVGAT